MCNRPAMNAQLFAAILMASALGALAADGGTASDMKVMFVDPPVRPTPDIPADARDAGTEADPDAAKGGASGIRFRIVRDPSDHGPLSNLVAGRITALNVTWSDGTLFTTNRETENFLRRLLTVPQGSTRTHVPWAQMLGLPSVVATVQHTEGNGGSWHMWYSWPSIYCVYRDGSGKW